MLVLHSCDNPKCINPEHLRIGTHADNGQDMRDRDRSAKHHGEKNGMAVLNEERATEVVELVAQGATRRGVAKQLGVSPGSVRNILKGETWSHITGIKSIK